MLNAAEQHLAKAQLGWSRIPRRVAILTGLFLSILIFMFYASSSLPSRVQVQLKAWSSQQNIVLGPPKESAPGSRMKDIMAWKKPPGMKVVALVFYGRRRYVSVLECYLKRNLVENGGILDEVIFLAKTKDKDDLAYLEDLIQKNPKYSAEYHNETGLNFSKMYGSCTKGNVYVKIDDDVLYIEDSTIRSIVKQKVEHPEYLVVSANVVDNFATAWLHYRMRAIHPYLPDLGPANQSLIDWRTSKLPSWTGPKDFNYTRFHGERTHRWLPVPSENPLSRKTPMDASEYTLSKSGWHTWRVAAQQHYSLFQNLERNELWRYRFVDVWDASYNRVAINFIALSGDDIVEMSPMPAADEQHITMDYPRRTGRRVVIDGHGVAAHNGFASMQPKADGPRIEGTDVLERYRMYAEEFVCGKPMGR